VKDFYFYVLIGSCAFGIDFPLARLDIFYFGKSEINIGPFVWRKMRFEK
jgi:hypothetical protein